MSKVIIDAERYPQKSLDLRGNTQTETIYGYLPSTNLTRELMAATNATYNLSAATYARNVDYIPEAMLIRNKVILGPILAALPPSTDAQTVRNVLIAACGTGSMLVSAEQAEIQGLQQIPLETDDIHVFGFDYSMEMLQQSYEYLDHKPRIVQADIGDTLPYKQESFEGITATAVLQHLPKEKIPTIILNLLSLLKVGGILHFDVRVEMGEDGFPVDQGEGRVFYDTILGGYRFYNTYTESETTQLLKAVKRLLEQLGISDIIDFELVSKGSHHQVNRNKPHFYNVILRRTK